MILFNCDGDIGENIEKTITMVDGDEIQNELRQIIGLLNHLAIHTRPDIMFPVTYLATRIKSADKNGTRPMADDPSIWHKLFRDPLSEISKKQVGFQNGPYDVLPSSGSARRTPTVLDVPILEIN